MKKTLKTLLSLLLVMVLGLYLPGGLKAEAATGHISAALADEYATVAGDYIGINLDELFTDAEGHSMSFTLLYPETTDLTKIQKKNGVNMLYFTPSVAGTQTLTVKAGCTDGDALTIDIPVEVEPATDGLPIQYNYNQTPSSAVTVYVTVSNDGVPILGNDEDQTALCHVPITVPYFDLGLYGLEDYYRYHSGAGGGYDGDEPIERPTALHLYIYLLERYYLGLPESECLQGDSAVFENNSEVEEIMDMFGCTAYSNDMSGLCITGSSTSMYMQNFWGHDENLMYYRNHAYPLMRAGWGSTADYILLSENDTIDLAMFTNWGFYTHGGFLCFGDGTTREPVNDFTIQAGTTLNVQTLTFGTMSVANGGVDDFLPLVSGGASTLVISEQSLKENTCELDCAELTNEENAISSYTFEEPGVYYLIGLDDNCESEDACYAPATARVVVTADAPHEHAYESVVTDPTCTEAGYTTYTCSCGDSYVADEIPATGHEFGEWTVVTEATVGKTGLQTRACANCDATEEEEIPALPEPEGITIQKQPEDYAGALNDTAEFTVEATGDSLTYQWYYSKDGGTVWAKCSSATKNTYSLTLKQYRNHYLYRCELKDSQGNKATTDAAELYIDYSDVIIVTQPVSVTDGSVNQLYIYDIEAEGKNLTYQWFFSTDGGETWAKSFNEGSTTAHFKVRLYSYRSGYMYRCEVTSGFENTVVSDAVSINLQAPSVKIIASPENYTGAIGSNVSLKVTAEGNELSYRWYKSNDGGETWVETYLDGYKTDTLQFSLTNSRAQLYRCEVTDGSGKKAKSDSALVLVRTLCDPIQIQEQPVAVSCVSGKTATMHVAATGTELTYQWQVSTDNGTTWKSTTLTGNATDTLSFIATASRCNNKQYRCLIKDINGDALASDAVTVTLK